MLYNLDWLREGNTFPPRSEIVRLKKYSDSRELFDGNTEVVLSNYQQRISRIAEKMGLDTTYKMDINYHRLVTVKTADMICSEMPNINTGDGLDIKRLIRGTKLKRKLYESVCDVSRFGDSIARVYYDDINQRYDFVIMPPDKWFPIVSIEDCKTITQHVFAYIEELPKINKVQKPKYILKAQIHKKGYYENRVYNVEEITENVPYSAYSYSGNPLHSQSIIAKSYKIGQLIQSVNVETGLLNYAVVPFQNLTMPNNIYAYNDYEPITPLVAELEMRMMVESAVLDKHSTPTIYADESSMRLNPITDEFEFVVGSAIRVPTGGVAPGYMIWDANLQANHETIKTLKDLLNSITEMGAVINDAVFGASQGYEALVTRMTNARMKARRISDNLTDSLAELIALLSTKGYGEPISSENITIEWNDGIPDTEYKNADIALRKLSLMPLRQILIDHFGYDEERASVLVDELKEQQLSTSFSTLFNNGVGSGQ